MKLAVVIPTRNRPNELLRLLENLSLQTRRPDRVIIIDGSDEAERGAIETGARAAWFTVDLQRHWPPSAAAQRNRGLSLVPADFDLVALIDDDVTLDPQALAIVCRWAQTLSSEIIGLGLNPEDEAAAAAPGRWKSSRLARWLGLYSDRVAVVTPSGWHTRVRRVDELTTVDWLSTCAVAWRVAAIRELRFDEFFQTYSYLEDLEFSLQAARRGRFVMLPDADYLHLPAPGGRNSRLWFGQIEIRNRLYIVHKHGLSLSRFWLGVGIRAALTLVSMIHDAGEAARLWGNLQEIAAILWGKTPGLPQESRGHLAESLRVLGDRRHDGRGHRRTRSIERNK
ncbi:glycosyltransferase [Jiella sp. MQZ9-1]|uniref:Glycosyltransferase n=1 Tax=Jiella flava TaxID=2816857 RepID=A0A939FVU8_9HYPH|nr:glycosyltransferase [Jiella flava]MCD2471682.1 glycosyltransferase [Jiella flava]